MTAFSSDSTSGTNPARRGDAPQLNREPDRPTADALDVTDRYRELFAHAPVAALVLDCAGIVLDANIAASNLLQSDRRGVIGRNLASFVDAPYVDRFARYLCRLTRGDDPQVVELALVLSDSARRDVRLEGMRDG